MSQQKPLKCPRCGSENIEVVKTWQLVSPFPDSQGRITITVMGVMKCKDCGHSWRGPVSKLKVGGRSVEIEGAKESKIVESGEEPRPPKEIIIDLDDVLNEE